MRIAGRFSLSRDLLVQMLHLFVLCSFAVAQPIFAVLRESPSFFVTRRAEPYDLILWALGLIVLPPLLAGSAVMLLSWIRPELTDRAHGALVGILIGLTVLPLVSRIGWASWSVALGAGTLVAVGAGIPYLRSEKFRQLFTLAAPAPLAFATLFLFTSPMVRLVLPSEPPAGTPQRLAARAPVIFIIFDELPTASLLDGDGNVNAQRFPNFGSLAAKSFWFPHAMAVSDMTTQMIPAILTGNYPRSDQLPTAADHPRSLFTLLGEHYEVQAMEPFTQLCPAEICEELLRRPSAAGRLAGMLGTAARLYPRILLPKRYELGDAIAEDPLGEFINAPWELERENPSLEELDAIHTAAVADQVGADQETLFRTFLSLIVPESRRLYFAHFFLPHTPYSYLPEKFAYPDPGLPGWDTQQWTDPWLVFQGHQRQLLQLRRVDALIGELVQRLQEVGIFDDALIVIMADHGSSFHEGGAHRLATEDNVGDIGLIPLFMKAPRQTKGIIDPRPVLAIDVLSGVADLIGVDLPWETDGRSPFGEPRLNEEFYVVNTLGDRIRLESPEVARLESSRMLARRFGPGGGPFDLFAFGDYGHLVGQEMDALDVLGASSARVSLEDPDRFRSVDLSTGIVPAYFEARLSRLNRATRHIAVVLNGVVATVVPVFDVSGSSGRLSAVLPGHLFQDGDNELDFLAVSGDEQTPEVRLIRTAS